MAARRKRDAKGRFVKGSTRKKTPRRKARATGGARRRTAAPRRRVAYRRNPARPDVVKMLTRGTMTATQVLLGKALTRAVPDLANLPKAGNAGLAVEVAVALGLGFVSEMFFTKNTAAAILAGGLTAPVERLVVQANVPYLSQYLGEGSVVSGYVPPSRPLAGYVASRGSGLGQTPGDFGGGGVDYPPMWT